MNERRIIWATMRAVIETDRFKRKKSGKKSKSHWNLFQSLLNYFVLLLKLSGLYRRGLRNAKNIRINKAVFEFNSLPLSFNGLKILHLSDLHIDTLPGIEDLIIEKIRPLEYDLCLITGDYRKDTQGPSHHIYPAIEKIIRNIRAQEGIYGILGNHDSYLMVKHLERMGVHMLINESIELPRKDEKIIITGTDDPYYYFTDMAIEALEETEGPFKIAMVHTSELFDIAAKNHYDLYLCGHTHGGQICLPGGFPLITHQFEGKQFFRGKWKFNELQGYTSSGCGVSAIPIRFNCPGEITLIELIRNI
ncbi:MAG: metallophosphoesterase [Bacteroidales bacterium]|nr:metallophosphoesterase [Bacteroidales bacterium]MCF8397509.1 metallophosphoesterase [Bacteroidales bacterium]